MTTSNTCTCGGAQPGEPARAVRPPAERRRRRLVALGAVASLVLVGLVASPAPSQASHNNCTSALSDQLIIGTLEVPAGEFCDLNSVLVLGNVNVRAGGQLNTTDSGVAGRLTAYQDALVFLTTTTILNGTVGTDAFAISTIGSTMIGGVSVERVSFLLNDNTRYHGKLDSEDSWVHVRSGQFAGSITSKGDPNLVVEETRVSGNIHAIMSGTIAVCESVVAGAVSLRDGTGNIQIGGDLPMPECGSNTIGGGLALYDNVASDIQVSSNLVIGGMDCTGNSPAPEGDDNLTIGPASGQCADLSQFSGPRATSVPVDSLWDQAWAEVFAAMQG